MTLTIQLPDNLESALRAQANAQGISEEGYVRTLVERALAIIASTRLAIRRAAHPRFTQGQFPQWRFHKGAY